MSRNSRKREFCLLKYSAKQKTACELPHFGIKNTETKHNLQGFLMDEIEKEPLETVEAFVNRNFAKDA